MPESGNGQNVGKVIEIQGVVIDALFTENLPEINTALRISVDGRDLTTKLSVRKDPERPLR